MTDSPAHTARTQPSDEIWTVKRSGTVVARSSAAVLVLESYDGNEFPAVAYLPIDDVQVELQGPTGHETVCPVKGKASYYSPNLEGDDRADLENSVWYYPNPMSPLEPITGHVAFYGDRYEITSEA